MKMGKASSLVVIAVMTAAFITGCRDEGEKPQEKSAAVKATVHADKIATLEKDVARLKSEVQYLRHRIELEEKMHSRTAARRFSHRADGMNPGVGRPEDLRKGGFRSRKSEKRDDPSMRIDPADMTPEQRRAWHEERRRMREERMREKAISESGKQTKQTNPESEKGEAK